MLKINVTTAEAVITETELITSGRKGLKCQFTFSGDWSGLQKIAVIQGVVTRDIALMNTNEITIPGECLTKPQFPLKVGVYGALADGTIAIPTIWANFGKIAVGTKPSDVPPDELTPDVVAQIEEAASNALYLARNVQSMADSGALDGVSPEVTVTSITGGHNIKITDRDHPTGQDFDVPDGQDGADGVSPTISSSSITGGHRLTIVDAGGTTTVDVMDGEDAPAPTAEQIQEAVDDYLDDNPSVIENEVDDYLDNHPTLTGTFTNEAKNALIALLSKVAYIDGNGQTYLNTLETELRAAAVSSIEAVYTQSGTVYDTGDLDDLKEDLVVTASYADGTSGTVTTYTLSGTLTAGTSTITVTYGGKTDTFDVTVTHAILPAGYTAYDYIKYIGTDYTYSTTPAPYMLMTNTYTDLNALVIDFDMMPYKEQTGSTAGILGGQSGPQNSNEYEVSFYGRTDTQRVSAFSAATALGIDDNPNVQKDKKVHINLNPGSASPSTLTVDSLNTTGAWTNKKTINTSLGYFGKQMSYNGKYTIKAFAAVGTLKLYNLSNELVGQYVPCVRDSDSVIGIYDTVGEQFYTVSTQAYATVGNANCVYAVGNWGA